MSFSEFDALSTRAAVFVLEGMQVKIVAENNWTASSLSFSSDLVRGVHARGSVVRRETRNEGDSPSGAFSHARGHLRVSGVLLDGPRKERDCSLSITNRQRRRP